MGVSTDGILFYGYWFEEGMEFPWSDDEELDWESYVATRRGATYDAESPEYFEQYQRQQEVIKSLPVTLGTHCSGEYPMWYLAIKASEQVARRGSPKSINPHAMAAFGGNLPRLSTPSWNDQLIAFADEFKLPRPGQDGASEIGWWLASYWG
jgi:hypothetical protein